MSAIRVVIAGCGGVLVSLALHAEGKAASIFSQKPLNGGPSYFSSTATGGFRIAADDFYVSEAINEIIFWGAHRGSRPADLQHNVIFYKDDGNVPSNKVGESFGVPYLGFRASFDETGLKTETGADVYRYTIKFLHPIDASEGYRWVSVVGRSDPDWAWLASGPNGGESHATKSDPGAIWVSASNNLAFELKPVPIPAALPLFASGLAALGFFGWRRHNAA